MFQRYASVAVGQEESPVGSEQSLDCSNDAASSQNPDEFVDQRNQGVIEEVSSLQPPAKKSKIKERAVSTVSANKNGAGKTNMLKHSEATSRITRPCVILKE